MTESLCSKRNHHPDDTSQIAFIKSMTVLYDKKPITTSNKQATETLKPTEFFPDYELWRSRMYGDLAALGIRR